MHTCGPLFSRSGLRTKKKFTAVLSLFCSTTLSPINNSSEAIDHPTSIYTSLRYFLHWFMPMRVLPRELPHLFLPPSFLQHELRARHRLPLQYCMDSTVNSSFEIFFYGTYSIFEAKFIKSRSHEASAQQHPARDQNSLCMNMIPVRFPYLDDFFLFSWLSFAFWFHVMRFG
jgi:hypothetical protein